MSFWSERLNPSPVTVKSATLEEFDEAWKWAFEMENGELVRAMHCLPIVRANAKRLAKQGIGESGKLALVDLHRKMTAPKIVIPKRRS